MKQYATSGPVSVVLDIPAGHIRLVAAERTEVGYGDGVLRVKAAAAKNRLLGPSGSLEVTIRCPPASHGEAKASGAEFRGAGRLGDVAFEGARLTLQAAWHHRRRYFTLHATTQHGDITARSL